MMIAGILGSIITNRVTFTPCFFSSFSVRHTLNICVAKISQHRTFGNYGGSGGSYSKLAIWFSLHASQMEYDSGAGQRRRRGFIVPGLTNSVTEGVWQNTRSGCYHF